MKITHKEAKSILTPSKLPSSDYVVNPYSGCAFGCVYCYADFTRKFTGHMDDKWGEYVDIKVNTPEIFEKEINKLAKKLRRINFKKGDKPVIFFGSVTDPYQGVEAKYQLTRKCLEIVAQSTIKNNIEVSLLTKSPLVTRDIDIFKQIPNLEIGLTITSTDDVVSKIFESCAPPSSSRIKALKELNESGIYTYGIVNCAGVVDYEGKSIEKDIEVWDRTLAVNLTSNYLLAKYFKEYLEEKGRFIMISSTDAIYGGRITASYSASKAGVNSLTRSLCLIFKEKK